LAVGLWLPSQCRRAALVTLTGDNVIFTYDDSNLGLFGAPKVHPVTTIFFFAQPTLRAQSRRMEAGIPSPRSTITLGVQTKSSDLFFGKPYVVERGDYLMLGSAAALA